MFDTFDLEEKRERFQDWMFEEHLLAYERTLIAVLWVGTLLTVVGCVGAILTTFLPEPQPDVFFAAALWTLTAGVGLILVSALLSRPLDRLHQFKADQRSGSRYERRRNWTQLKTSAVLLNLLMAVAAVELGLAVLTMFGAEPVSLPNFLTAERITLLLVLAIAANLAYTHRVALRIDRPDRTNQLETSFFLLSVATGAVMTALGASVAAGATHLPLAGEVVPGHATLFLLAGITAASAGLFLARRLPTVRALYLEEREYQRGGYASRQKSVVMPTMIAFALLFLVLLLTFILELSVIGDIGALAQNYVILGLFGFIVLALIVSVAVSASLARSEDQKTLYRKLRTSEEQTELTMKGLSGVLGALFLAASISIMTGNGVFGIPVEQKRWVDTLALGLLGALGPYGFYYAHEARRVRQLEERFPDFLRDLAASRRAGLTLTSAVKITSQGEYGALTPDIEKMADQISWNVSFENALDRFSSRVDTPLVRRACTLINEAGRSGGHVIDVLEAAATDAREIKTLENERRLTMTLYTVVIYVAFLVFLGVSGVLYGQFIPQVLESTQAAAGSSLAAGGGALGNLGTSTLELSDYRTFFFIAALSQGIGNGILAGQMETGRPLNGLRHAFIMVAITFVVFVFFLA